MTRILSRRELLWQAGIALAAVPLASRALASVELKEAPLFVERVIKGKLPPIADRIPKQPLVFDPAAEGRQLGKPGGSMTTLIAKLRDVRYLSANGYTRLVGYTDKLVLQPDILASIDDDGSRVFTLHLRQGHRWSDGQPFTTEDFRYYWEDIINNKELNPSGVPTFMMVQGKGPTFEIIDEVTVRFSWDGPNPLFLPTLAAPQDPFIYRPAHFLKKFHAKYTDKDKLAELIAKAKVRSWAPLHNRMDSMLENSNPELPTLFPWRPVKESSSTRIVFERNAYFHRIDIEGQQLPYVDRVFADVAAGSLFAAKSNAGEVDFLARGLNMNDIPVLKQGEKTQGYKTLLWRLARGSEVALYPNLNATDTVWRALNRDVRFRRALSLAIDRHTINNALLFGLGQEGNNTVREGSSLFKPDYRTRWAAYDDAAAAKLLDEIGLAKGSGGIRNLPDGRPVEVIVEVDSDTGLAVDTLELITEFWREVGVKLFIKPQDRTILRNRAYEGQTIMVASQGLDNAIPTAEMAPSELAPIQQDNMAWPKWGQYVETKGKSGEAVDLPEAQKLLSHYKAWLGSTTSEQKTIAWHAMLELHAENQWIIGTVAGALQPIVLRDGLINLPTEALYSWAPTSLLGVYRIDQIFWDRQDRRVAQAP